MMNPIRNVERALGPGGPAIKGANLNPARKRPHNYPIQRAPRGEGLGGGPRLFQEGGEVQAAPDPMDLREPEEQLSPHDQGMKEVVTDAMMALRGESPEPEKAIQRFIDMFGEADYRELRQMVLGGHAEPDADDAGGPADQDEDDIPSGAPEGMQVGGLLRGPGTGQDDKIEAATPTGRKVLLSDGEYVIDAPTVAALGDGSTSAGARRLDRLRKVIREQAYGHDSQAKPMRKGGRALLLALNG